MDEGWKSIECRDRFQIVNNIKKRCPMKLKGQTIKVKQKEYVLKEQLGEGGFSMIYQTNYPEVICKAQVLLSPAIAKAYHKERQILKSITHPHIVKLYDSYELETKQNQYGLLFMEKCSSGTAFDVLEKNQGSFVNEKTVLKILLIVADVLQALHRKGIAHRDIKMENVLINAQGEYKLCDFGSCSKTVIKTVDASNRIDIEENIEKTTTPLYRSPEQLDLYSGFEIGTKVDIFALGVLAFMMCFQKPPFESRLSAINKQYFLPEDHSYSKELVNLIERCFTTNPAYRPSAAEVKEQLKRMVKMKRVQIDLNLQREFEQALTDMGRVNESNLKKNSTVAETGLLDKIKRIYNQITTQTEGWIAGFVEDNEQAPVLKYNRSIISKCYEKKYKIQKVYDIIEKYSEDYKGKSLVILKLLILLHNFLRKGPKEAIMYEKESSPLKFCLKIYRLWKMSMKTTDEEDFKRNPFVCLLIRSYSLILAQKIKLCYENSHLIEANYSIAPYLEHIKQNTILKLDFISAMLQFLQNCLNFHEQVQRINYLTQIQKSIILSLVDEEYCLVSTLTFIFSAFKIAICYVKEDIDLSALQVKVQQVENKFQQVYRRLAKLLDYTQKNSFMVLQSNSQIYLDSNINLNLDVIGYVRNLKIEKRQGKFSITDHLNYKNSIYGLKIPLTYEEVVRNPDFLKDIESSETNSKIVVEVNQFKVKKEQQKPSPPQLKTEKTSPPSLKAEKTSPPAVKAEKASSLVKADKNSPPSISKKEVCSSGERKQSKKEESETSPTVFSKPRNPKDKIFQNFNFDEQKKIEPKIAQPQSNMMEFTHQNLNKDFLSIHLPPPEQKNDQFRDFFSIVEQKFQKQKITKKNPEPKQEEMGNSNASKEVFYSSNQADINKIELMNFFFDEDQSQTPQEKAPKVEQKSAGNLIDIGQKEQLPVKVEVQKERHQSNHQNLIPLEQASNSKQNQANLFEVKEVKPVPEKNKQAKSGRQQSVIDLKQFVVEEVRKNAEQYIIEFSTLVFKEKIGYGNSSEVFKGEWRGREVAIKKIKDNLSRSEKEFKREIMTSVKIRHHPQLVTLIGVSEHDKYFYIINEFCNGSTLFDLLHESNQKLPWPTRINIAKQIARGMIFLHTNDPPIIHRDLKSLNVLLVHQYEESNPGLIQIKIADFGLSRDYASTYMTGTLGTYHWMAPEIFSNEQYTLKADIYSYGIVLWEIASRVPPYTNMKNPHSLMKFVTIQNGRPDMSFVDKDCPLEWRMLMTRCWDKFPSNRPNFSQILNCLEYLSH